MVSALASFIEDSASTLGSGWKPLFSALKAVRPGTISTTMPEADETTQSRLSVSLIDVFKKYITNDDVPVVLATMADFIHCVLHYVESSSAFGKLCLKRGTVNELLAAQNIQQACEDTSYEPALGILMRSGLLLQRLLSDGSGDISVPPTTLQRYMPTVLFCGIFVMGRFQARLAKLPRALDDDYDERTTKLPPLTSLLPPSLDFGITSKDLDLNVAGLNAE